MKSNQISINGSAIVSGSKNITIVGNRIIVDGIDVTPDSKDINITVNGNIESLDVDCCDKINIVGAVAKVRTTSGDINISGNVTGDVKSTSGDIKCGQISGSVKTVSGDIKNKKY